MSFRRRTRMVSFRVSEDEFEQLKTISESEGTGSVSDYARLSLCSGNHGAPASVAAEIHKLDNELQSLRTHLERLTALVESTHNAVIGAANSRHNVSRIAE